MRDIWIWRCQKVFSLLFENPFLILTCFSDKPLSHPCSAPCLHKHRLHSWGSCSLHFGHNSHRSTFKTLKKKCVASSTQISQDWQEAKIDVRVFLWLTKEMGKNLSITQTPAWHTEGLYACQDWVKSSPASDTLQFSELAMKPQLTHRITWY